MRYRLTNLSALVLVSFFLYGCAGNGVNTSQQPEAPVVHQKTPAQIEIEQAARVAEERRQIEIANKYNYAVALMSQGKLKKAENIFISLTKSQPELSGPWVNLGIMAEKNDQLAGAKQFYTTALQHNDKNVEALNNLGVIKRNEGLFEEAKELYSKGLNVDSKNKNLNYNMAVLNEIYLNNYPQALHYYESYVASLEQPDPKVDRWIKSLKRKTQH